MNPINAISTVRTVNSNNKHDQYPHELQELRQDSHMSQFACFARGCQLLKLIHTLSSQMNYTTWKKTSIKIATTHLNVFAHISHMGGELKLITSLTY